MISNTFNTMLKLLLSLTLVVSFTVQADDNDDNKALNSFLNKLSQLQNMQANFIQVMRDGKQRELQELSGKIMIEKPGKLFWQTNPPYEQLVISDGLSVWIYDMDLEQVTIRDMENRIQETPALLLSGDASEVSKNFTVKLKTTDAISRYSLIPKDSSQLFEKLEFQYFNDQLESMSIFDVAGQVTEIIFENTRVNQDIDPNTFVFKTPEGVDVIDGRHER